MNRLPIVITGTIVPRSNFVFIQDWRTRKHQYVDTLRYFSAENQVFFLENSEYDLDSDADFKIPNLKIVRICDTESPSNLGKGFQEFKMLDNFLSQNEAPTRFIKISGRRTLKQIDRFQNLFSSTDNQWFDLWQNDGFCDTSFFCCDLSFYREHITGLYLQADDSEGKIIEKVLYRALEDLPNIKFHPFTPLFVGQHGTSGNSLKEKPHIPTELRRFFRALLGKRKLDQQIFDW